MYTKAIIITGCSSGIGLCVARGLSRRGYRVFATARKYDDVKKLSAEGMESLQLDLNCSSSIHKASQEVLNRTGGELYALFNNGGYGQPGAVEDLDTDTLRAQFETNFFGWHELTRLILPVMRRQGFGRIIQNSSVLGFVSLPLRGAYVASKHAIEGLTDSLRLELKGTDIYVSLIEPGPIESQFRKNAFKKYQENIQSEISHFKKIYGYMEARLTKVSAPLPFTLPPEAVLKKIVHALESPKPKARYFVTIPTYLFALIKRVFPGEAIDLIISKAADRG